MSVTVQQLLTDAKRLVTRLREHDSSADTLVSQAQNLNNNVETMKQYHEEVCRLNGVCGARPRATLVHSIQEENRHLRQLQQENRDLREVLQDFQLALDIIMVRYRKQLERIADFTKDEKNWTEREFSQELKSRTDKISEMSAVMKRAIELDDASFSNGDKIFNHLTAENKMLRDILELNVAGRSEFAQKKVIVKTDESVQTEDL